MAKSSKHKTSFQRRAGVSLIESAISTLLVGSLAVTSLQATHAILRSQQEMNYRSQAYALCEQYLTEVLQASYSVPESSPAASEIPANDENSPPPSGKTNSGSVPRASLVYLDEFHGRVESPPQNRDGSLMTGLSTGWQVSIQVERFNPTQTPSSTSQDLGLKRVSVTVTDKTGTQYTLRSFRAKLSGHERIPAQACELVRAVGIGLNVEGSSSSFRAGAKPLDLAPIKN
jgi:hypothetical protein